MRAFFYTMKNLTTAITVILFPLLFSTLFLYATKSHAAYDHCVAGLVEDSPGVSTIDIYSHGEITSISNVSVKVAKEIAKELGSC